ncbi:MAG TPA: glutaredoxin family protein [Usitatibacter sp.]|nr:glutaredoxin family protein [Usitatibacter sp.]
MQSRLFACVAVVAMLAAMAAAHAATNVYRWVDKEGKVHFSDTPPAPGDVQDVSEKPMGGASVEESNLPYATQVAKKRNPVTLYTAKDCGTPCDQGRDLLSNRGVPFTEKNAMASNADLDALRKLTGGSGEVPFLLVGETKIRGYDEDAWNSALDSAGYPRTRLPGQPVASGAAPVAAAPPAPPGPANPGAQTQ